MLSHWIIITLQIYNTPPPYYSIALMAITINFLLHSSKWLFILHYLPFSDYLNYSFDDFYKKITREKNFALSEIFLCFWATAGSSIIWNIYLTSLQSISCLFLQTCEREIHAWSNLKERSWKGICYFSTLQKSIEVFFLL